MESIFGKYETKTVIDPEGAKKNIAVIHSMDESILSDECFHNEEKFDAVIVLGTPWVWDQFYKSPKYKNLIKAFEIHKYAKKIFLGVGSCLTLNADNSILEREGESAAIKEMFGNSIAIVRDKLIKSAIDYTGVESHLLPCPSYFCYGLDPLGLTKSDNHTLIWYNPLTGISNCYWQNADKMDMYVSTVQSFYKEYKPEVYCAVNKDFHYEEDLKWARKIGLPDPIILTDYEHTKKVMRFAGKVLSGRVHCGVPAFVQGKPIGIIPIDSRAKTLTDFGCQEITDSIKPFETMDFERRDFSKYLGEYKKLLLEVKHPD